MAIAILMILAAIGVGVLIWLRPRGHGLRPTPRRLPQSVARNAAKPGWVREAVGRTWVRQLLKEHAHAALVARTRCKHAVPPPLPAHAMWGLAVTYVPDAAGAQHAVLGIVDHGSRLCLALRPLRYFHTWTLLGTVLIDVGEWGRLGALRLDNHPVHRARAFKGTLRAMGVRLSFTRPASPWQNGRIERLFGTLKKALATYMLQDLSHTIDAMAQFQFYYNAVRPHQHLGGRTPQQVWDRVDPMARSPKRICFVSAWEGRLRGWLLHH